MANDRIRLTPIILIIWSIAMEALSNGDSYYVGRDWLESGPINNEHMHIRKKRVVGTNINDANFTFVEVASQTMGSMLVEIGDSFTFEVTIDLPGILDTKKSDMVIEIFGLDSSNGVAGIHVCQAHEEEISGHGENIRSIQEYPVYVNEMPSHRKNFVAKTRMIREQLHTEGFGDVGNANKIQAQFQAVVVNAGLDENWSYQNGGTHYITVGIQYGDEFLWIGQASFIVDLKNQDYDFAVNIESGPIDTDKTSFMKGKGYIFTIRANVVEPVADVALQVFQPLGYNDVFHIGHIQRRMGNAFACSPQDGWQDKYSLSPSDLTVNNASIFYSFLVNREAQRDISNDANEIVFLVPVHVMNIDSLPPGVNRTLSFVLQVGKEKIWTTLEERPISDQPLTLSNGVTPTFLSVRLLNNVTSNQIPKGDSIVFLVELRCPKSAYCKFDVELLSSANGQPAIPVGARIINGGTIAYFSPPWSVYANQDENVVVSFGKVENPASEDTDVSLELTYALDPTADDAHLIELVNPKIGGLPIVLPKDLKASSNNLNSMLKVEIDDFGFDENVHIHGQAAFELRVTVESGAGAEGLVLEAIPDLDFDHELRICSLRILDIGRGLPCVYHSHYKPNAEYYKSDETLPFNNLAKLKLDRICPYSVPKMDKNDNQFVARIVYESPTALKTTPSTFKLNGGLRIKDEVVWVASKSFQLIDTAMNTTNLEYAQGSDVSSSPFVATYPTIATRGRKPSFHPGEGISEQYILKFPPLSRGAYNFVLKPYAHSRACKIKITHIGENYPCTQPPGPMITGFENIEIQYDSNGNNMESEFGESVTLKLKGLTNWGRSPVHFDLTPDENSIQVVAFYQLDPKAIFTVNDVMDLNFELHEASSNGKIAEPLENDVVVDLVTPNEAQVVALEGNPSTCEIGEKIWIGYNITVPRGKTIKMERDIVTIDFGYVTNAGLSFKQGLYDGDLDDTFSLRFLIQKSDHQIWDRNMDRPIQCSIKFGDVATVVESWIGFEISKLKEEQGQMFITSNLSEPSKQYENGDTIYVQSVIKHDEMSTREGYPTFIQVIVPHYLTYKENSDSFLTNYSSIGNDEIVTVTVANTSGILFQFPQGISFPDIVELNFSLSVEMDGKRPIGSGVESSAIVFAPICFHSGHNKTNSSVSNCGSLRALPFESCAPGWAPALKTPLNSRSEFPDYLEFNFLAAVRIGQIYVHSETDTFRQVKTIQIQYGHIHGFFTNWKDPVRLDLGPKIEIDPSLEAQFIRLILVSTDIQDVMEKPPGISKVEFKGCLPQPQQLSSCQNEEESSRASEYFAVDDFRDIVYYCERLDTRARTNCYASGGRGIVAGWTELPKYVSSLIGYDQEEKLMLFTGLTDRYCFKSVDGQKITQLDCTKLETLPSLIEANRIRRPETTTSPQKGTWTGQQLQYGGRLEGIYDETNIILQWKSCCL
eukprot:TCALIF_11102-PA protein Name:"Protein of unknown function" AED:0.05 eAED:0.05 QI:9/0.85/0.90/1/0.6/0.47/21/323/1445